MLRRGVSVNLSAGSVAGCKSLDSVVSSMQTFMQLGAEYGCETEIWGDEKFSALHEHFFFLIASCNRKHLGAA